MSIIDNRKVFHEFFIEERYEAGIVLQGWEVKAIRAGRANIKEAYVIVRDGELFLLGSHITPLISTSTHVIADPTRTRKLLMKASEIHKLIGKVERAGFTLVPVNFHYKGGYVKVEVGLAKGKKLHDKRQADQDRDWKREQSGIMKQGLRASARD